MELKLKSDTRRRKQFFTGASFSHPAKLALGLQEWLFETFSRPGDIVLDPMSGSGTALIGALMGRHIILVELEPRFIKMCEDNWAKIQTMPLYLGTEKMGNALILQGDARNLEGILADIVITSPPYADTDPTYFTTGSIAKMSEGFKRGEGRRKLVKDEGYGETEGQIGDLPYGVDAIITSPPYEGSISPHDEGPLAHNKPKKREGYSDSSSNIGNLYRDTYLSAMKLVYEQCFKVLKPNGLLVLVVKPFIRNKKLVHLEEDTRKLCESVGFTFIEEHYRRLTAMSFWRTIYYRKYPTVERIDREYILIFKKTYLDSHQTCSICGKILKVIVNGQA